FEHHELSLLQMRRDRFGSLLHVGKVWLAALIERRRNANQDCIDFLELCEIRSRGEMLAVHVLLNFCLWDVLDVRAARIQHGNFRWVRVESCDLVSRFRKAQRQRQSDVSATDDANLELGTFKKFWLSINWHNSRTAPFVDDHLQLGTSKLL